MRPAAEEHGSPAGGATGQPIRILVSACLLGERVRYDGGHKRDPFLLETLGERRSGAFRNSHGELAELA